MAKTSITLDKDGIAEILKSPLLGAELESIAQQIATAGGGGYEVVVDYGRRKSRVISMVLSDDFRREFRTGDLARAVSQARK
jgi:hypothetical protein